MSERRKIETENNKCNFRECRNYENGECLDDKARKDCVEMSMAILCISQEDEDA